MNNWTRNPPNRLLNLDMLDDIYIQRHVFLSVGKSGGNPGLAVVTKNMAVPTVTIVTKPQTTPVVQRQAFRISTGTND